MRNRFEDKHVLVLGATGGIGKVVAKEIISEGGKVIGFSKNETKLQELKVEFGESFFPILGDGRNSTDLQKISDFIDSKEINLDSCIHLIGSIILRSIPAMSEEQFKDCLETNLVSPFLTIKTILPFFIREKKGNFVFSSSIAGSTGLLNHEAIAAAKGGLESMIRSASMTYAKKGIRFNAVALGLIDTPLASFITKSEASLNASKSLHPLDKIGTPEQAASGILYLASDDSNFTTGSILPIDGGMSSGKS